jgi:Na+-driven multidrug efflux pump
MIYTLRGKTFLRLRLADWRPDLRIWREMVGIGLPAGAEFFLMSITIGVIYGVTRPFGAQAQAGFGIGSRIMQAGFMPAVSISFSAAAVVGQNFGSKASGRVREALRESTKLAIGFMLLFTAICQLAPERMVSIFNAEPAVVAAGVGYLRIMSIGYVASGVVFVFAGIFQGLGNTWPSLLASGLRAVVFVTPLLVISQRQDFALREIWIMSVGSSLFQLAVQQHMLRRELRIKAPL